jgi:hypothetical protein
VEGRNYGDGYPPWSVEPQEEENEEEEKEDENEEEEGMKNLNLRDK